ncbi:hypothetical protein V6N13_106778 [Hibiscus sabdariffa]|uniref:RNase H type-1 domain-containing protein n=1 Tax=Hibiscus sabdariffa TaxID=183260 RepID=A0ABR2F1S8_9ROSI
MTPLVYASDDSIGWKGTHDFHFSIKLAYKIHYGATVPVNKALWRSIHKFRGLQKQPGGLTRAQSGIRGARPLELQHRGASSAMTGTGHVGMTGTAGHAVALDDGWRLPALGWSKLGSQVMGVYVGLGCALEKGLRKVVIEMDCSEAMALLLKNSERLVSMPILFHIRDLVRQLEDVEFKLMI